MSSPTSYAEANVRPNPLHRGRQRFLGFLFPSESDTWLTVFRIGLGLQVTLHALFLRSDWHYLFTSSGKGLVGRELREAITSFESPLIPRFGWLIAVGRNLNMSEQTVLTVAWVAYCRPAVFCCWAILSPSSDYRVVCPPMCCRKRRVTRLWRR